WSFWLFLLVPMSAPPIPSPSPYTTLFRSRRACAGGSGIDGARVIGLRRGFRRRPRSPAGGAVRGARRHHQQAAVDGDGSPFGDRSEEHTSELQSLTQLVCRLLLANKTTSS